MRAKHRLRKFSLSVLPATLVLTAVGLLALATRTLGVAPTEVTAAAMPAPRVDHAMVLDDARQRIVLFGGNLNSPADWRRRWTDDTWAWDGTAWRQLSPTTHPSARGGMAMAYDPALRRAVLFGGQTTAANRLGTDDRLLGDTWTWDGQNWTLQRPAHSPAARVGGSMTFDGRRLVLHGGSGQAGILHDTWAFDGTDWTILDGGSPAGPASGARLVNAEAQAQVLALESCAPNGRASTHFAFDGVRWSEQAGGGPDAISARCGGAVAYDRARQQVVVFGGTYDLPDNPLTGPTRQRLGDTLVGDGVRWAAMPTQVAQPPPRVGATAAFDPNTSKVLVFGGVGGVAGLPLNDTWTWDGKQWERRA